MNHDHIVNASHDVAAGNKDNSIVFAKKLGTDSPVFDEFGQLGVIQNGSTFDWSDAPKKTHAAERRRVAADANRMNEISLFGFDERRGARLRRDDDEFCIRVVRDLCRAVDNR